MLTSCLGVTQPLVQGVSLISGRKEEGSEGGDGDDGPVTPGPRAAVCDFDKCAEADLAFLELLLATAAFASCAPGFRDLCVGC